MNAAELIGLLRVLEGHIIYTVVRDGDKEVQVKLRCVQVRKLPPRERMCEDQGNVLLWNGAHTREGALSGLTLWARGVVSAEWVGEDVLRLENRRGWSVEIRRGREFAAGGAEGAEIGY